MTMNANRFAIKYILVQSMKLNLKNFEKVDKYSNITVTHLNIYYRETKTQPQSSMKPDLYC